MSSCLSLLKQQEVGGLEDINASDICAGRESKFIQLNFVDDEVNCYSFCLNCIYRSESYFIVILCIESP